MANILRFPLRFFFCFVRFFLFTFEKRSRTTLRVCAIFSSAARQCISFSFILFSFLINGSVVRWIGIKAKFHCISLMETGASERSRITRVILSLKEISSHRCAAPEFKSELFFCPSSAAWCCLGIVFYLLFYSVSFRSVPCFCSHFPARLATVSSDNFSAVARRNIKSSGKQKWKYILK